MIVQRSSDYIISIAPDEDLDEIGKVNLGEKGYIKLLKELGWKGDES